MVNFTLFLETGEAKSFQSLTVETGITRAKSILTRINAKSGELYRINPYGAGRKFISRVINEEYDPERPTIKEETFTETTQAEKPSKSRQNRLSKPHKINHQQNNSDYPVTLQAISERVGINPTELRRKLRKSSIPKPGNRWAWQTWEDESVKEILSWGK